MADHEQKEQELVVPDADERSRWRVRHLVGCAGVSLACIYYQVVHEDLLYTLLTFLLGLLHLYLCGLAWDYANHSDMATDDLEVEVEVELVAPEADERSRWAVTCLMGCAGVSFVRITCLIDDDNDPRMRLLNHLLSLLGISLCGICEFFVIERYLTPEGGQQKLVDKFLLL